MKSTQEIASDWVQKTKAFDSFEVICDREFMTEMQVDAGEVSLMRSTEETSLTLRAIHKGRYASLALNQSDDDSYKKAIVDLQTQVMSAPPDDARVLANKDAGFQNLIQCGPVSPDLEGMYSKIRGFSESVARQLPEIKLDQSAVIHKKSEYSRANSHGYLGSYVHGAYDFWGMFSAKRGGKSSSFNYAVASAADLSEELLNWGAMKRLLESSVQEVDHSPLGMPKFVGEVVLAPECFLDLLQMFLSHLKDEKMISKTSALLNQINDSVASRLMTLQVRPDRKGLAHAEVTTMEGYLSRPSTVIQNGVLKSWMLSDYGSRKTGLRRAENGGLNLEIDPGAQNFAALVSEMNKGLYMARFSFGVPAANGEFSGVAKNSYLIEHGKIVRPLSEVMVSGNLFDLMKNITGLSAERLDDGTNLLPFVRVRGLTIS